MAFINKIKMIFSRKKDIEYYRKLGVHIGRNCEIYEGVSFGSEPYLVSIGNHVRITKGVQFITHDGGVWVLREKYNREDIDIFGSIRIGNNVHLGINSVIMPGVTIGNDCVIACGAVVTKNIPDGEIWGGIPAKKIKNIEEYYQQHMNDFHETKYLSSELKKEYLLNLDNAHLGIDK